MSETNDPSFKKKKDEIITDLNNLKKMLSEIRTSMQHDIGITIERANAVGISEKVLEGVLSDYSK